LKSVVHNDDIAVCVRACMCICATYVIHVPLRILARAVHDYVIWDPQDSLYVWATCERKSRSGKVLDPTDLTSRHHVRLRRPVWLRWLSLTWRTHCHRYVSIH